MQHALQMTPVRLISSLTSNPHSQISGKVIKEKVMMYDLVTEILVAAGTVLYCMYSAYETSLLYEMS